MRIQSMKPTTTLILLVTVHIFLAQASAQTATEPQDSQQTEIASEVPTSSEQPYQVVVTGQLTRSRLRNLIEDVEEDFFAKFNELNTDDAYDMYCYEYTPTMSHIKKRACEPLFLIKYREQQTNDQLHNLSNGQIGQNVGLALSGIYLEKTQLMAKSQSRHYEILIQKMEDLTQSNQELGEIADAMQQLKLRLENYGNTN